MRAEADAADRGEAPNFEANLSRSLSLSIEEEKYRVSLTPRADREKRRRAIMQAGHSAPRVHTSSALLYSPA